MEGLHKAFQPQLVGQTGWQGYTQHNQYSASIYRGTGLGTKD